MKCTACKAEGGLGGMIGRANKAKFYCLKHYFQKHKVTKEEVRERARLHKNDIILT